MTGLSSRKVPPLLLLITGGLLLFSAVLPVGGHIMRAFVFPQLSLIDPSTVSLYPQPLVITAGVASADFTLAQNWFAPQVTLPSAVSSSVSFFSLSLPRLRMIDIPVEVNGTDLKKNAIHYPGTPLPGSYGNTVIFGHSALPQFYRPDNPLTVFNPLLKARVGDQIEVKSDGISYRYVVRKITEVKPSQIEVLAQNFSTRELTLITCTPLGTYWRRFVVKAELI